MARNEHARSIGTVAVSRPSAGGVVRSIVPTISSIHATPVVPAVIVRIIVADTFGAGHEVLVLNGIRTPSNRAEKDKRLSASSPLGSI